MLSIIDSKVTPTLLNLNVAMENNSAIKHDHYCVTMTIDFVYSTFFIAGILVGCEACTYQHQTSEGQQNFVESQHDALLQFYLSTKMYTKSSMSLHSWRFDCGSSIVHYCNFTGVTCDRSGMVINLELNSTQLSGLLPPTFDSFSRLQRLRLFNNSIQGTIPHALLRLTTLQLLNLGQNRFTGTFPDFSSSLVLTRLFLDRNALTGTIPSSICNLTQLTVIDISKLTRMRGTIPLCFGKLSNLIGFRLTDIGLGGSVPSDLCGERDMNGLTPNYFGCDAIACPVGTFQRAIGRQVMNDTPCIACNVPSNVIGSTICQWHESNVPTSSPSNEITPPYLGLPSLRPTINNGYQTKQPSNKPADNILTTFPIPSQGLMFPSFSPSELLVNPVFTRSMSPSAKLDINSPFMPFSKGILVGISALILVLFLAFAAVIIRKRKAAVPRHKSIEDTSSDVISSIQESASGESLKNLREMNLFSVDDDNSFMVNDKISVQLNDVHGDKLDSEIIDFPVKLFPVSKQRTGSSPKKAENSIRKVRFDAPNSNKYTKPAKIVSPFKILNDASNVKSENQYDHDREAWVKTLWYPFWDPIVSCGVPCQHTTVDDPETSSVITLGSIPSIPSNLYFTHGSDLHDVNEHDFLHQLDPHVEAVLGIRNRIAKDDNISDYKYSTGMLDTHKNGVEYNRNRHTAAKYIGISREYKCSDVVEL